MSQLTLRFATSDDAHEIFRLVSALATYEKLEQEVISSSVDFERILSDPKSNVEVLLALWSGETVGFALFFENYSTFLGKPGLYLEDLFVQPDQRSKGIGTALMMRLIEIAKERNYGRVEWTVLDWNEPAIKFYTEKIGAKLLTPWRICRVEVKGSVSVSDSAS
jgi:GNAT superfamily N-acetyltransferase